MSHLNKIMVLGALFGLLAIPATAQTTCLPIDKVDIGGVAVFDDATVEAWVEPFQGRCLGLTEFDEILETVTTAYIDAGYIMSRAFLPQQDISDGQLDIAVVEGELTTILMNGQEQPRWSNRVFPGQTGKPVNLRDVEQGLDVIQGMPRWNAQMEFESGESAGESVLAIAASTTKPIEFKFTSNNQGNDATGLWISGLSMDTTNWLGYNETYELGVTRSLSPGPVSFGYDGDLNRSGYFRLKAPYGKSQFTLSRTWSDYRLTIPGAISPIPTWGDTDGYGFEWKRLLYRDQSVKNHLTFNLDVSSNKNYIQGALIEASSRRLTSFKITHSHEGPVWGGKLTRSWSVDMGLKAFGAEDADTQPAGAPDAQYLRFMTSYDFEKPFTIGTRKFEWDSAFKAQYSNDRLHGGQLFSVGGTSTVRGTKIALARGSSGWVWRNKVATQITQTPITGFGLFDAYAALDMGRVLPQSDVQATGGSAVGGTLGIKSKKGPLEFDLSYQRILSTSGGLQRPDGEVSLSISYTF